LAYNHLAQEARYTKGWGRDNVAEAIARLSESLFGNGRTADSSAIGASAQKTRYENLLRLGNRLALGLTLLLLLGVAGLVVVRTMYSGRVLPSVYVADVSVGGMTKADAYVAVERRTAGLLNETFVFDYDGRQWTTTLADLGVQADVQRSVDSAYSIGREPEARDRVSNTLSLAQGEEFVPLAIQVDSNRVDSWINGVTEDIGRKSQDAQIHINNGVLEVTGDVDGIVVDKQRLSTIIRNSLNNLTPYRGPLPVALSPASIHESDIEPAVEQLNAALSSPIKVVYKEKQWRLQPADLGQFVVQTPSTDGPGYTISVDDSALGQWLFNLIGERINREPVDAEIHWDDDKDKVVATSESSKGVTLLAGPLADAVIKSFLGDHQQVDVPVKGIKPNVDSNRLDELNITTKLGVGTSSFYGSNENRATNIWVGTGYLNGTVVAPGEDFSFNDAIGDITEEAGYVEAAVVDGERIGKDIGGGICQVSTTVFRAAFLAGFPIGEWWPHLYRIPFYEYDGWAPGLDASILQSGPRESWGDFTFNNSTGSYILIEAYVQDQTDTVAIYGPETGWNVDVSEPREGDPILGDDQPDVEIVDTELPPGTVEQTELRQDGLEISYERVVTDASGTVVDDWVAYSRFAARGDVWKVSSDMAGQSPATLNPHKPSTDDEDD
jgi:vancomycin resistance protein YoaR